MYALILAISEENGLEHFRIFEKSVDTEKFVEYLDELYVENKHDQISLFADNLSVHRAHVVREKLQELDIEMVFNLPYQPDLNPSESAISIIKNYYKRQKLNKLVNEEEVNHKELIIESIK